MQISLTFKNITSSDALKSRIQEKFDRLDKMLDGPAEAHVVLSVEKIRHIVEVNFKGDKFQIHAKEEAENMYASIDAVADIIKLQIQKNKEKLKRHLAGNKESIKNNDIEFISPAAGADLSQS
ncbi:MAG: ribosome-associated translation inhibitor RaiA [Proteobacteria bacterium]|nr:ribosome-associated translation inhibitor RaiA [Desulfobacula sp.]MBU3951636.1 ribosome-associated translation inhibitor RaiA [Pseudomonadota bacterium]MBU4132768.1 ribosome-associated translation inhibitor RaiA [Pseudomonadota bacterium]